jgi:hypothetical protein
MVLIEADDAYHDEPVDVAVAWEIVETELPESLRRVLLQSLAVFS